MGNRIIAVSVAAGVGLTLTFGSIKMGSSEPSKQYKIHYSAVPHAEAYHVPIV